MADEKSYLVGKEAFDALTNTDADRENEAMDKLRVILHLKQRIDERGLTQMQLAEMADVRQATISQLTRGNVERLHIPTLEKIAWALGITDITQLLTFELESEIMNLANPYNVKF